MTIDHASDVAAMFDTQQGFAKSAAYRVAGADPATTVAVLLSRPDDQAAVFGRQVATDGGDLLVQVAEVATPAAGDTFTVGAVVYTVQGVPRLDGERVLWTVEVRG